MSDKQSIKELGNRAIASTMFYLSIMAFIIFIFIDLIIVVALIVELVKGGDSVVGILVGMLFSFALTSLLARASLKYDKKRARELPEFKKFVNVYSKFIENGQKGSFLSAVESIVGGREKAKPFGLAGLQYIESKIKI